MTDFKHLDNLVIDDHREGKREKTKEQQIRELKGLTIRLYQNGEVYPSRDLGMKFGLEYRTLEHKEKTNGFDLVDSTDWNPTKHLPRTIFVGVVAKTEPKVDLFSGVRYDQSGNPINSVYDQGTKSKTLLELAKSMGWLAENDQYVDLVVRQEYPVTTKDGIAYVPKNVERGKNKDQKTYERRENVTFYPLDKVTATVETTTENKSVETTAQQGSLINN